MLLSAYSTFSWEVVCVWNYCDFKSKLDTILTIWEIFKDDHGLTTYHCLSWPNVFNIVTVHGFLKTTVYYC